MSIYYIPTGLFAPLPDWLVPWVLVGALLFFTLVVAWAFVIRARRRRD